MMKHCIVAIVCAVALTATSAWAGPKAVERPFPSQFFSDKTVMLTHIDVTALSSQRIYEALKALIPAKYQADMNLEQLRGQMAMVDGIAMQLKSVNINRITAIAVMGADGQFASTQAYILAPISLDATEEQKQAAIGVMNGLGAMVQGKVETIPGWLVMHSSETLPEVDEFAIEDAAFSDAMAINPDHDISIVIVPTPDMRQKMAKGMNAAVAEATEAEEREALQHIGVLTESEWYYLSLVLGNQPELRIATKASTPEKARQFSNAWSSALHEAKMQIKREVAEQRAEAERLKKEKGKDFDPADFDPEPMMDVMNAFAAEPDDQTMVIAMDRARLMDVINGMILIAEGIGEAVGEAMAAPVDAMVD